MKKENIENFEKLHIQIKDIYKELGMLSKKTPDGAINKFKLKFVNQLLIQANELIGKNYKPFEDFTVFDEDTIPTNSDVVLIVSQYIQCLEKFKYNNVITLSGSWYWKLSDSKEEIKTSYPLTKFTM